jgi:hypothetical protein
MTSIYQVYSSYILYVVICRAIPGIYHYYTLSADCRWRGTSNNSDLTRPGGGTYRAHCQCQWHYSSSFQVPTPLALSSMEENADSDNSLLKPIKIIALGAKRNVRI